MVSACSRYTNGLNSMLAELYMPPFPEVWASAEKWELSWQTAPGKVGASSGAGSGSGPEKHGPVYLLPGDSFAAELDRRKETMFFAKACFGSFRTLPYGLAWPQACYSCSFLEPGPEGGYAATTASCLQNAFLPQSPIDLVRLGAEAGARMDDPWDIQPSFLASVIISRRFRADYLKNPKKEQLCLTGLPIADAVVLQPDSPWGKLVYVQNGSAIVEIVPGILRFWCNNQYELRVFLTSQGEALWTVRKGF